MIVSVCGKRRQLLLEILLQYHKCCKNNSNIFVIICFKFKGSVNQVWKIVDATQTVYLWKRNGKSYDDLCKYLNYFNADHTHSIFEGIQER